jgi:hypothetical protein
MRLSRFLLMGCLLGLALPIYAQQKSSCKEINAKVEFTKDPASKSSSVQITFDDKGDYTIQILDSKGNIRKSKSNKIEKVAPGEYDLVITDDGRTDRCPFYKRIKVEAN